MRYERIRRQHRYVILTFSMNGFSAVSFITRLRRKLTSSSTTPSARERLFWGYPEGVKYLVYAYATDDVIAQTDAVLMRYIKLSTVSLTRNADALENKSGRCGEVHEVDVLKGIFI